MQPYQGYQGYGGGYIPSYSTNKPRTPVYRSSYMTASPYSMSYFAQPAQGGVYGQVQPTMQAMPGLPANFGSGRQFFGTTMNDDGASGLTGKTPQGAPIPPVITQPSPNANAQAPKFAELEGFPDINLDPTLIAGRAQIAGQRKQFAENDLAAFQQALLGFGSQDVARKVLQARMGEWNNKLGRNIDIESFASGLSADPDTSLSTMAQLARRDRTRTRNTLEGLGNLFYAGAGARRLDQAKYDAQAETAQATNDLYAALAGYANEYNMGLDNLRREENQLMNDAWMRGFSRWQNRKPTSGGSNPSGPAAADPTNTASMANFVQSPHVGLLPGETGQMVPGHGTHITDGTNDPMLVSSGGTQTQSPTGPAPQEGQMFWQDGVLMVIVNGRPQPVPR